MFADINHNMELCVSPLAVRNNMFSDLSATYFPFVFSLSLLSLYLLRLLKYRMIHSNYTKSRKQ